MATRKIRGYYKARDDAKKLSDRQLARAIQFQRAVVAQEYDVEPEDRAKMTALEDEAVDRLVERY